MVGHEPDLSELVSLLLTARADAAAIHMKKGGVACLLLEGGVRPGSAQLRWLVTPKILRFAGS